MANSKQTPERDKPIPLALLEEENMYHWEITFEIKVDKVLLSLDDSDPDLIKQIGETDEPFVWVADSLNVRAGEDALIAVNKAKAHVLNESKTSSYELACLEFKLTGVKLLSAADL